MHHPKFNASLLTLIIISAAFICVRGQGAQSVTEFDPAVALSIDLPKRTRLEIYTGTEKSEEIQSRRVKVGAGFSVRLKPLYKGFFDSFDADKQHVLVLGTVYEFGRATEPGAVTNEHRLMFDATVRYEFFKRALISDRSRFENRWINGEYHARYRNRPMIERSFKIRKRDVTPYLSSEAFWDQRYKKWNMFKFSGGVVFPVFRRTSLDVFYERQHCSTCADPNTNIFGVSLIISIRLGKR